MPIEAPFSPMIEPHQKQPTRGMSEWVNEEWANTTSIPSTNCSLKPERDTSDFQSFAQHQKVILPYSDIIETPPSAQLEQDMEDFKLPPEVMDNMNNSQLRYGLPLCYYELKQTGTGRFETQIDEICTWIDTIKEMFEKTQETVNIEIETLKDKVEAQEKKLKTQERKLKTQERKLKTQERKLRGLQFRIEKIYNIRRGKN